MLQYLRILRLKLLFMGDFIAFRKLSRIKRPDFLPAWKDRYACLYDKTATTGYDRHYLLHTAWAARKVAQSHPEIHTDISSSLYFCSIVSAFVPIEFYDYRPADLHLDGLHSRAADLLTLPFSDGSIKSLSCMHVVEHVGLGRYGDPLDSEGDLKAIAELKRVLAKDGNLLFVVPLGQRRVMFNAHRIYSYDQILEYFSNLTLVEFSLIPDSGQEGGLVINASKALADTQSYGCGCFWFKK
jgi:SAM-dependent methyltransferase